MENPVKKATLGTRHSTRTRKARNTTQETKTLSNTDPIEKPRWTQVLVKCWSERVVHFPALSSFMIYHRVCN